MTLEQAITQFLFHCQYEKNLSPKTLKAYSIDLRQFRTHKAEIADRDSQTYRTLVRDIAVLELLSATGAPRGSDRCWRGSIRGGGFEKGAS